MYQPVLNSPPRKSPIRFFIAGALIVGVVSWLAISGARDTKSYYVTITELQAMGDKAHHVNLRVAGNVKPGTITRSGPNADFTLVEQGKTHRHLRPRRHLPRHSTPGQVRQQVRPRPTRHNTHGQHRRAQPQDLAGTLEDWPAGSCS